MKTAFSHVITGLAGLAAYGLFGSVPQQSNVAQIITPEAREILSHMRIVYVKDCNPGSTATHKTIRISGVNVQIVNGMGSTNGNPGAPKYSLGVPGSTNGLGNLIVGYNQCREDFTDDRSGSHNLVLGDLSNYTSYGGLVAGYANSIEGAYATVNGGGGPSLNNGHKAMGDFSSVAGGEGNLATGFQSAVCGGTGNESSGTGACIVGGTFNLASGVRSVVVGGLSNTETGSNSVTLGS